MKGLIDNKEGKKEELVRILPLFLCLAFKPEFIDLYFSAYPHNIIV